MNNKLVILLVIIIAIIGVGSAIFMARPHVMAGSVIDPPVKAPAIDLPSSHGEVFHLQEQRGKIVLLFFGYTFCPDVCPTTLFDLLQIKKQLGEKADQVTFVFVTVDPQRDTQEQLAKYLKSFDESFFGLTGEEAQLEPIWSGYGVYHAIQDNNSSTTYLVDHTSRLYLIDQKGQLSVTYLFDTPVEDIVSDLKYLLKQGNSS